MFGTFFVGTPFLRSTLAWRGALKESKPTVEREKIARIASFLQSWKPMPEEPLTEVTNTNKQKESSYKHELKGPFNCGRFLLTFC